MTKEEVLKIHTDVFYGSLKSQNYAALEELYSDDYMLVRPDGSVLNKQEVLYDLRANGLTFQSIDLLQSTGRIYGPTAVLTGESRTVTSRNRMEVPLIKAQATSSGVAWEKGNAEPLARFLSR